MNITIWMTAAPVLTDRVDTAHPRHECGAGAPSGKRPYKDVRWKFEK
jgi:hypothetical protein